MVPAPTRIEIRKHQKEHPDCTVRDSTRYLRSVIAQATDEKVAEALRLKRFQDLAGFKKSVHSLQTGAPFGSGPASQSVQEGRMDETTALLQRVCAALEKPAFRCRRQRRTGSKPNSKHGSKPSSTRGSKRGTPRRRSPRRTNIPEGWPGGCFHGGKQGHLRNMCRKIIPWKKNGPWDKDGCSIAFITSGRAGEIRGEELRVATKPHYPAR